MTIAVIVGSAFDEESIGGNRLTPHDFDGVTLHRFERDDEDAWVLFRHGAPHRFLPNQIPYRAQAAALRAAGVGALLVTSSVGVMNPNVPLFQPRLVGDLFMPDNRLPDGTACTMFEHPTVGQGHLVIEGGLFDRELSMVLADLTDDGLGPAVSFAYVGGPRTKTTLENAWLADAGVDVNSMTLGPEVVLANELEIATTAIVVGHKYSGPEADHGALAPDALAGSLSSSKAALEEIVVAFLSQGSAVEFKNTIYRFNES